MSDNDHIPPLTPRQVIDTYKPGAGNPFTRRLDLLVHVLWESEKLWQQAERMLREPPDEVAK